MLMELVQNDPECLDFIFENPGRRGARPIHEKILAMAVKGFEAPDVLADVEVRKVCYALIIHYSQMGVLPST